MTETSSPPVRQSSQNRAYALDALRGLAILAMLLSGQLPFDQNALPAWMYHGQESPPDFQLNVHLYGITWVDLVFPFFLFAMGAAFPLAYARRMEQGTPRWKLALFIVERGCMLGFFALYVEAIRPHIMSHHPTAGTQWLGLLGFALLFPIYTRLPDAWPAVVRWSVKIAGWIGAILFLAFITYPEDSSYGTGFSLFRSDIIIVVLTNMAVFGTAIWMLTRKEWLPRLGVLGILMAIRLSNIPEPLPGWVSEIWRTSPIPWMYKLYYLQYLFIVIPGTIAGDLILQWTRSTASADEQARKEHWCLPHALANMVLMFAFVLVALIGLRMQWVWQTTLILFAMYGLAWWHFARPNNATEELYKKLFQWASYWLVLGLFFEHYEGGIRKSQPATVSYYFVTVGLAICVFIGFSILIDGFGRRRWVQWLIDNGQNPMIAYAGINNFVLPILALAGADKLLADFVTSPWRGFLSGLFVTLLMAATVSFLTRRKIFWRT